MQIRFIMQMTERSTNLSHEWWRWDHQVASSQLTVRHYKCECCSLLVILKYNQPTQFREAPHLSVHYKTQKNNWIDKDIFLDWFTSVFCLPEVKQHLKTRSMSQPCVTCILLLDNQRAHHLNSNWYLSANVQCYLPSDVTWLVQPTDLGIT